jgi:hypothetical protein
MIALRGRRLAPLLVCLWASAALAMADDGMDGRPVDAGADVSPVARKLWGELVCLCGRCQRLPLSHCHCPMATAERKKILDMLGSRDLATASGQDAAHASVLGDYVTRFGRDVLASETSSEDWVGWGVLGGVVVVFLGGILVASRLRPKPIKAKARRR